MSRITDTSFRLAAVLLVSALIGCQDPIATPPTSLSGPTAIAVATGKVCLDIVDDEVTPVFDDCQEGRRAAIGLIVNEHTDRLAFAALSRRTPRLANLGTLFPGVTHLKVGRLPVDVAASPDGTVAYTLNQIDRDISIVNLWGPEQLSERIPLDDTPIAFAVDPRSGHLVTALGSPSRLVLHDGVSCQNVQECDPIGPQKTSTTLPGTVTDLAASGDGRIFVVYRDLDEVTVVNSQTLEIENRIPAAWGCSDGLDNDGDGLIDQQDPKCYGPRDHEGPLTPGRSLSLECADGIDNDGDGLIDREDPSCLSPSSSETDLEFEFTTPCRDGVDNDSDGATDYPEDPACYGLLGRTEAPFKARGFDAVDVDPLSNYIYAVDRARSQVVVFDATREELIDAPASMDPPAVAFVPEFGIPTSLSPIDVAATVRRDCLDETNTLVSCNSEFFRSYPEGADVVVRHEYGAFVSEDTGRIRFVATHDAYCTVPFEDAARYLGEDFFFADDLSDSLESRCIFVPQFPLDEESEANEECDVDCGPDCDPDVLARRLVCNEGTATYVNPRFSAQDVNSVTSRFSRGNCEIPAEVTRAMNLFANFPGAPRNVRCDSALLPQPLEISALDLDPDSFPDLSSVPRATMMHYDSAFQLTGDTGIETRTSRRNYDERVFSESWTVEFEGPLPDTRRSDAILDSEPTERDGESVVGINVQGLDLCRAGVQEGDRLRIVSAPEDSACDAFSSDRDDFNTFEIVDLEANQLWIRVLEETSDSDYARELPTRTCFSTGTSYEIRPHEEWIVTGSRSGYVSDRKSRFGLCVPRLGSAADETGNVAARGSRVETGDVFVGPYFRFWLYPGPTQRADDDDSRAITPSTGLRFTFESNPNFRSRNFRTDGVFPAHVNTFQSGGRYRVISTDPNSNFLFYKDARSATEFGNRVR